MSKRTKTGIGAAAARGLITDPEIRSAAAEAAPPVAKLGLNVGKRFARRRTRRQLQRLEQQINSLAAVIGTYGPVVAQQLGAIDRPKAKRTAPRIATGVVIGASAMYLLEPGNGANHRRQVQRLVVGVMS